MQVGQLFKEAYFVCCGRATNYQLFIMLLLCLYCQACMGIYALHASVKWLDVGTAGYLELEGEYLPLVFSLNHEVSWASPGHVS